MMIYQFTRKVKLFDPDLDRGYPTTVDWFEEFSPYYEVPGFIPFLVRKGILKDSSWNNDSMPSFGAYHPEKETDVRLWVDHPFKSHRDLRTMKRFLVTSMTDGEEGDDVDTDDLDEALKALFIKLAKFHREVGVGVLAWRPDAPGDPWNEPLEYLEELKSEYQEDPRA